jgi:hypothetical protein
VPPDQEKALEFAGRKLLMRRLLGNLWRDTLAPERDV